ncbi:hypothetical protein [Luteolibacter soli]|uniref:Uncharacterized protein n=1 Tax=Luteolibacter soli TaxID=3135280 RepID=A0ABU9AY24_9BACT
MKTILLLIALALPCVAGPVFTGGVAIHSGSGDDQKSKAFEFKGPYVLQWTLTDKAPSKRDDPYWRPTTESGWKQKRVLISVRDAATGALVVSQMLAGRENHLNIPEGGKHYLVVNGDPDIAWEVKAKEGRVVVTEKGETMELPPPGGWASQPVPAPKRFVQPAQTEKTSDKPAAVTTAPEPKPSSVPGLPPGVEPTKKAATDLPPGMQRTK